MLHASCDRDEECNTLNAGVNSKGLRAARLGLRNQWRTPADLGSFGERAGSTMLLLEAQDPAEDAPIDVKRLGRDFRYVGLSCTNR